MVIGPGGGRPTLNFGVGSDVFMPGIPGRVTSSFDIGGALGAVGTAACGAIRNPIARQACLAAATIVGGINKSTPRAGNIDPANQRPTLFDTGDPCPRGTIRMGDTCVSPGDMFPGGAPGTFPAGGVGANGAMGMPAVTPEQSSQITLRCPRRYVLAIDNLCYPKGFIPRSLRKWKPEPRPMVSAMDAKIVKRAKGVQKRIRKAQTQLAPRPSRCGPKGKKR